MKDPADAYTIELPLLGDVALPDWLRPALRTCPSEGAAFAEVFDLVRSLPGDAPIADFMLAYDRMLEARERLYDAWLELELELDEWDEGE